MKRIVLMLLLLMLCVPATAAVVVPVTGEVAVVAVAADGPQAALRRMSRSERQLAREVIRDAASAAGMRRLEFMRAVQAGDQDANDELKLSLLSNEDAREIDVERFREIMQIILDFISQLMTMFSMFADNDPTVLPDGPMFCLMNIAMELTPDQAKPDQVQPDQAKPDQTARRTERRRPVRRIWIRVNPGKRFRMRLAA